MREMGGLEESLEKLNNLTDYYNCSTKEIIDALFDNKSLIDDVTKIFSEMDEKIKIDGVRKTFVISRNTKQRIDEYAKREKVSRDLMVNGMIIGFYISHSKTLENHKWAIDKLDAFRDKIDELECELLSKLSMDDPIIYRMGYLYGIIDNLTGDIDSELEENIAIDKYNR